MFDWGTTRNLADDAKDNIARITLERYRSATLWQKSERVGEKSLRTVLQECYDQINSIMSCAEREQAEALRVNASINLTAMKVGVVHAFLSEALIQPDLLPWAISPTPIPDLSEDGRMEALELIKREIFEIGFNGDLDGLVQKVKLAVREKERDIAERRAKNMELLMSDQTIEGGWRTAVNAFLMDFAIYPYAVMHGPVPTKKSRMVWENNKLKVKKQSYYEFRNISPFDFWYSPDSRDTQSGTSIFIRQRFTRRQLLDMVGMQSYFADALTDVLFETEKDEDYNFKWMSENPDQRDDSMVMWQNSSGTIDAMLAIGLYSGRELGEYGISGLEDNYYDATATIIGGRTVQVYIQPDPSVSIRPVHTASFYKTRDRIAGSGIAQRMRDVDRAYQTVFRYMLRNVANASEPIVEADHARLSPFMSDEDLTSLVPGSFYLAKNDGVTNAPALRLTTIPSVIGEYANILQYLMELGHLVTNIPAALHGMPVGTGMNRTFRGAALLQGNAVKSITAAVNNIDETVLGPLGTLLFNWNMLYEKDLDIRGDSNIVAQGVQGLLSRELDKTKAEDVLQFVAAAGPNIGSMAAPLYAWSVAKILRTMGVPEYLLEGNVVGGSQPGMEGGQAGMPTQPGVAQEIMEE